MTADNRVVLDYTNRDYKSIRAMLVGLAGGFLPEWATVGETGDFGTLLLELFAYNGDIMNYYIDRVGAEAFLGTATRRQSVMFIADMLGYTPIGQHAATVPVSFTWSWDKSQTQVDSTVYSVVSVKIENKVGTFEITNPDIVVNIVVGQTVDIANTNSGFDGAYIVQSITPATTTTPFSLTIDLPLFALDLPKTPADPGITITTGASIILPQYTVLSSSGDSQGQSVQFELDFDVLLDSHLAVKVPTPGFTGLPKDDPSTLVQVTATGTATEGVTVTPTSVGVSNAVPNAEYVLPDIGIIDDSVTVYTREGGQIIVWGRIDTLAVASPTQSVFSYFVDDQDQTHIVFGDNASGRIPPANAEIFVGYRIGIGLDANKLNVGDITTLNNDYATGQGVTVTNTTSPSGGSDTETIESMRFSIPRANAVRQRAVNLDDYKSLALQVPGVTKAFAYGDTYTSVFVRIAASADSQAYVTDRIPYMRLFDDKTQIITAVDHSNDIHAGDEVFIETQSVTGSYTVDKLWVANPTNPIEITGVVRTIEPPSSLNGLTHAASFVTVTCAEPHGLSALQPVTIIGVDGAVVGTDAAIPAEYDGTWLVSSIPDRDRKTFTYHVTSFTEDLDTHGNPDPTRDQVPVEYTTADGPHGLVFPGSTTAPPIPSGTSSFITAPGMQLDTPGYTTDQWRTYHPTVAPPLTGVPNLAYPDRQMRNLITAVESYLLDKELIGAVTYAEPVEWANVIAQVQVTVRPLYNRTAVATAVKDAVMAVFDYDNVDFGLRITEGDVYRAALTVDGVDFLSISALYLGDPMVQVTGGTNDVGQPIDPGIIIPVTPGVGDIVTPPRSIPRLDPAMVKADTWVTSTGGLVHT